MRRRIAALLTAAVLGSAILAAAQAAVAAPSSQTSAQTGSWKVAKLPVEFRVRNVNDTAVPCQADGKTYTVRGEIVAPEATIGRATSATLYLHGLELGAFFFDFKEVPDLDFADQQARAGLTSVVIDRLGYGLSDKPNGFGICIGSHATIAHQIVGMLKTGRYRVVGAVSPPRFGRVALAGHSVGGQITQIEAYTFHDVDKAIIMSYSDVIVSNSTKQSLNVALARCAAMQRTGGYGYTYLAPVPQGFQRAFLYLPTVPPPARQAATALASMDPCGDLMSYNAATATDLKNVGRISVPVLFVHGLKDAIYPPPAEQKQAQLFTGTHDLSLVEIPLTGHGLTFHVTEPYLSAVVANWLIVRGYGGPHRSWSADVAM